MSKFDRYWMSKFGTTFIHGIKFFKRNSSLISAILILPIFFFLFILHYSSMQILEANIINQSSPGKMTMLLVTILPEILNEFKWISKSHSRKLSSVSAFLNAFHFHAISEKWFSFIFELLPYALLYFMNAVDFEVETPTLLLHRR